MAPPLVQAHSLAEIRGRGHLIVGIHESSYPLAYRDPQGAWAGLEIDLAHQLALALFGTDQVSLKPLRSAERLPALEAGTVDLVIGNLTITPERTKVIDFSAAYYQPYQAIVVRSGDPAQRLADLQDAPIALLAGSSAQVGITRFLDRAKLFPVSSYGIARDLLLQGKVRAVTADNTVLMSWCQADPSLRLLQTPLAGYLLGVGLPKGLASSDFRDWVNQRLAAWQADQSLSQLVQRWSLVKTP